MRSKLPHLFHLVQSFNSFENFPLWSSFFSQTKEQMSMNVFLHLNTFTLIIGQNLKQVNRQRFCVIKHTSVRLVLCHMRDAGLMVVLVILHAVKYSQMESAEVQA